MTKQKPHCMVTGRKMQWPLDFRLLPGQGDTLRASPFIRVWDTAFTAYSSSPDSIWDLCGIGRKTTSTIDNCSLFRPRGLCLANGPRSRAKYARYGPWKGPYPIDWSLVDATHRLHLVNNPDGRFWCMSITSFQLVKNLDILRTALTQEGSDCSVSVIVKRSAKFRLSFFLPFSLADAITSTRSESENVSRDDSSC